nr:ribosomal RNA small subunit methyltransferase E 1-like [Nerophis lumbriciformis]
MNLLLVEAGELSDDGRVRLAGRRARHLLKVLRVKPGRRLRAAVVSGAIGEAEVEQIDGHEVVLRFELSELASAPEPWLDLILALPRPAVLHRVLQTAATVGVGRLWLINSWRVEKSFFSSPALEDDAIQRHLLLGAEQGGVTHLPEVRLEKLFVPFLERLGRPAESTRRVLAEPRCGTLIEDYFASLDALPSEVRFQLAIGPEGGWIEREVESFGEASFAAVELGPWVLRVETAVAAAVAQLELLRRARITAAEVSQAAD